MSFLDSPVKISYVFPLYQALADTCNLMWLKNFLIKWICNVCLRAWIWGRTRAVLIIPVKGWRIFIILENRRDRQRMAHIHGIFIFGFNIILFGHKMQFLNHIRKTSMSHTITMHLFRCKLYSQTLQRKFLLLKMNTYSN